MSAFDAVGFVKAHGVVLASAAGPVPSLAAEVAGGPIRGSWWSHPKGQAIFRALEEATGSKDVLVCRLIGGKITLVHRSRWPALVRLATRLARGALDSVRQIHTPSGAHKNIVRRFPRWVPPEVRRRAQAMDEAEAEAALGAWSRGDGARAAR